MGYGISKAASILNYDGIAPPQGKKCSKSLLYNLKLREGWHACRPVNVLNHINEDMMVQVRELRDCGTSDAAISRILNESGYVPYKGKRFTESGVRRRLDHTPERKLLTPWAFGESIIRRAEGTRPSYPVLARLLTDGKFVTPHGNAHWWPAQVQQLLNGVYDLTDPLICATKAWGSDEGEDLGAEGV